MGFSDDDKSMLQACLELTDYTPFAYSGRGMMGRSCLAVDVKLDGLGKFLGQLFEAGAQFDSDALSQLGSEIESLKTDSLGKGMVVYFSEIDYLPFDDERDADFGEDDPVC
jgi:hypothetical protein